MNTEGDDRQALVGAPPDPAFGVEPAAVRQLTDIAGVGFAQEVVALYYVTGAEKIAAVVQGTAANAPARVLGAAHSLASCAGAVGAVAVAVRASAIEADAAAARVPGAAALTALEQDFADSRRALEAVLTALAAAGDIAESTASDDFADGLVTDDDEPDEHVTADLAAIAVTALVTP